MENTYNKKNKDQTSSKFSLTSFLNKNWAILYALTLLAYTPFLFYFIWGNHDWPWILDGTPLSSGLFEGRFSQFILQTLLTQGNILPILTLSLGLLFLSLTPVILLKIWSVPQSAQNTILLGLFLTTAPYTLAWLYFAFIILSCLSWTFFVALSFYILQKQKPSISIPLATILILLAIGGYPPIINMVGIILFSLILNDLSFNKLPIKDIIKKYLPHAISIILSIILFSIIIHFLKKYNLQKETYNTASINLSELAPKLLLSLKLCFQQFFMYKSFIIPTNKHLLIITMIIGLYEILKNLPKTFLHISLYFLCILGLLISSILTTFAATNTNYVLFEPRIEFFSIVYIYLYFLSINLSSKNNFIKNLSTVFIVFIIFSQINTISYAQKVWKLGFISEGLLSERIIKRIENHPNFQINRSYIYQQSGVLNFRGRFHTPLKQETTDVYFITAPYIPWHIPTNALKLYYPQNIFSKSFDVYWSHINPLELEVSTNLANYLQYYAEPYPNNNSIYLNNDKIIITLTRSANDSAINWLHKYYQQPY